MKEYVFLESRSNVAYVFEELHRAGYRWCDKDSLIDTQHYLGTIGRVVCVDSESKEVYRTSKYSDGQDVLSASMFLGKFDPQFDF
ncbi:MAG: hypothetical protein RR744_00185 [Cellulosilyticaceae bacterium]